MFPFVDRSVDRVIFKSVLLYVPDVAATLAEAYRVLRPGGTVITQDIDFWLSACTAFPPEEWRDFQEAMRPAFRDPTVGRHLRGHLLDAGFQDVKTIVSALVDDAGLFQNTLEKFLNFARALQTHPPHEIDAMSARATDSIHRGRWLYVQNFFQANGTR